MSLIQSAGIREGAAVFPAVSSLSFSRIFRRTVFLCAVSFAAAVTSFGENTQPVAGAAGGMVETKNPGSGGMAPVYLGANNMSIATGKPSLVKMSKISTHIPVWSFSGGPRGQSVAGFMSTLPSGCAAVKVEIIVTTTQAATAPDNVIVFRCHLSQMVEGESFTSRYVLGTPVQSTLPAAPFHTRTILLASYYKVEPGAPLWVRIQREPAYPADTFTQPVGLALVKVTPLGALAKPRVVQDVSGYNSWPMIQAIGEKLVCVYSRGTAHSIGEDVRACYARTSTDNGRTWTPETVFANTPNYGEVVVGKGLDSEGAMFVWVRRIGSGGWFHDLYRTTDGVTFDLVSTPDLAVRPMQITDVFSVPKVGLMALWFAGRYKDDTSHSWGKITSTDNGKTWIQTPIESGLTKKEWPTEPSAVYLGDGRILAIGRTEGGPAQFQMVSTDYGVTWTRARTNIGDVAASTPTLIFEKKTGLLSNYYYQRGAGILWRRVVNPEHVFDNPLNWPASEVIATGSRIGIDSGNVNATFIGNTHYLSFYSGKAPDTAILLALASAPTTEGTRRALPPPAGGQK